MRFAPAHISALIDAHQAIAEDQQRKFEKYRRMYRCQSWPINEDAPDAYADSGGMFGFVETMVAAVTPRSPRVSVKPRNRSEALIEPSAFREALINYSFEVGDLEWALRRASTFASLSPDGYGAIKTVWRFDKDRVDYLPLDSNLFWFDWSASKWEDIQYAIHVVPMPQEEFKSRILTDEDVVALEEWQAAGGDPAERPDTHDRIYDPWVAKAAQFGSYPQWIEEQMDASMETRSRIRRTFSWCLVYEVYDFTNKLLWLMLKGNAQPLHVGPLPFLFAENPFSLVVFIDDLDSLRGTPDAQIIERPLNNLDELDSLELMFVRSSIPITHVDESAFHDPEHSVQQLQSKVQPGDIARHRLNDNKSMDSAITWSKSPALSPNFGSIRDKQEQEIMYRQGMPEYARGVSTESTLATEVSLMNQALQNRQGWRINSIMKCQKGCAMNTIGLYEQFLDEDSLIAIRVGKDDYREFQRAMLEMRDPAIVAAQLAAGERPDPPLQVDYEVVPYQPASNTKPAQLARLVQSWPLLERIPKVNLDKAGDYLIELLDIDVDITYSKKEMEQRAAAQMQQQQGQMGSAPKIEASADTPLNGGGMPYDVAGETSTAASGDMAGGAGFPMPASVAGGA